MKNTYLFYDIETTGLNPCFDQILQFAAIRTTLDLQEVERYQLTVKLNPDVIPSPSALTTHRIPMSDYFNGMSEFEAIQKIHAWVNAPGTLSLGYNTLNFDDEFLRFSFYRNLLPPYTHQFAHQCGRLDIFPMVVLYYLYRKEALTWPMRSGAVSLKLEHLNEMNHLHEGRSHDAMVDVEVTLRLARKLYQHSTLWNYALGYFQKKEDQKRLSDLSKSSRMLLGHQEALAVSPALGKNNDFQSVVVSLGVHAHYQNQTLWLRLDEPEFAAETLENISQTTRILRKRWGEPCFLLPLKERFIRLTPDTLEKVEKNRQWIQQHPSYFEAIKAFHQNYRYPDVEGIDIDALLYQSRFWDNREMAWLEAFHQAPIEQKIQSISKAPTALIKEQIIRLLGRHYFDDLPAEYQGRFTLYLKNAVRGCHCLDYRGRARMTVETALIEIEKLREGGRLDSDQVNLLNELEIYCTMRRLEDRSGY